MRRIAFLTVVVVGALAAPASAYVVRIPRSVVAGPRIAGDHVVFVDEGQDQPLRLKVAGPDGQARVLATSTDSCDTFLQLTASPTRIAVIRRIGRYDPGLRQCQIGSLQLLAGPVDGELSVLETSGSGFSGCQPNAIDLDGTCWRSAAPTAGTP